MEIVIAVAAKIAEHTVRPVGQWLCYSCHYKSNMENLKELEKTLRDAKNRVQHDVDAASNNGDEIEDDVNSWLTKVDGIIRQLATKKLGGGEEEAESRNSNASCLNLKQRHQISREAKEMVDNIAELLKKANFARVSYRPPASQEMVTPRNLDYMTLDSRISITKRIMEALGDANINKIGVWGSPGVGKSTLMKEIFKKAKEESLFDEVALANVTDSPNLSGIQGEIADMLDLKLDPNCKTEMVRADHLRKRLEKDKEKKILVILDDIWKRLDLEEIGITPSERCKVLLTSRDRQVLASEMGTEKNCFKLDILGEQEAWNLFEKMAGDSVKDDHDLRNAANEVSKACGGLPIALVTVSRALKNKNLGAWKDALVQLTRPTPKHDTKIWLPVYSCIELSYKHLHGSELQSFFLLCARQGYYISYRDLLRYGFGLCLFHGIVTLEEARNRLENLVRDLQDACLLIKSPRSSKEFYMHDVVRHVATIIASNDDHNMFVMRGDGGQKAWPDVDALKKCKALSIHGGNHIHNYPNQIECPKLRYFHVQCEYRYLRTPSSSFQGMGKLEHTFFQGMEKLEVLSLTNIQLSSLLPLTNLQTLCLDGCNLGDIYWIGELKTLVILSLARSDISNLPGEIGSLTGLRLLDLTGCSKLQVISPNVLSSLVNLEELYMRNMNVQWEVEGPNNKGKNASLAELKHLSHLIALEIQIPDANYLPKDSEQLERYMISIGDLRDSFYYGEAPFSRTLKLKLNRSSFQLDFGIKMLLKKTEYLYLDESNSTKSVLYELDREDFQQLKHLHIQNGNIKHIPELRTSAVAFPILEKFVLKHMISLEEIYQVNLPLKSFENLKVLEVENCEKLRFIFSSSIARGLSLLEELKITRCSNVGAIFVKEDQEDHGREEVFRRLQTLELEDLPKLVSFFSTRETNSEGNHDLQLPLLHQQLSFPSLKNLHLQDLPKIKHVWSNVNGCESLKSLEIQDCGVMEDIVAREDGTDPTTRLLFPSLTLLTLDGLPKLKWFFQGVRTLESSSAKELHEQGGTLFGIEEVAFPNLTNLNLCDLPKIKHVWNKDPQTILRFQNLREITAERCASLKSLFPALIGTCLKQLKEIRIEACGVLEEIVGAEGGEAMGRTLVFEFPQITSLYLENLPRLECFYRGVHISKWPMLETMTIEECEKVEVFASGLVSFEETVEERQYSQMSIKQPLFLVDELSFSSLKTLHIRNMDKLEIIWQDQVAASSFSKNIQDVLIHGCEKLLHVFQSNFRTTTILTQRLTRLRIRYCPSLETIFRNMEGHNGKEPQVLIAPSSGTEESVAREDGTARHIEFPILTEMSLGGLPKLKWILEGVHTNLECPSLEILQLGGCEQVIWASKFASSSSSQEKSQQNKLRTCIQLPLPNLLELELGIRHVKLPSTSFKKLRVLKLENCEKLRFIFPSSIARGLSLLEELEIKRCNNMGAIVVKEEKDRIEDGDVIMFHQLQTLVLEDLPELVSFLSTRSSFMTDSGQIITEGNRDLHIPLLHHQVSFPSLQTFRMKGLPKIKHVWRCGQEPKIVFRCIEQLKILEIEDCGVEEIVAGGGGGGEPVARTILEFPLVTDLRLINLKRLKWFYKGVHVTKWPMLEMIWIIGCEKVEIFASGVVSFEETVKERSSEMSIKQPLFLVDELSFSSLKTLHIWNMDKLEIICQDQVAASSFSKNIQDVLIHGCEKLLHVFQSNFRTTTILTQRLTRLRIRYCPSLETIFRNMKGHNGKEPQVLIAPSSGMEESVAREDGIARHIEFPILTEMILDGLPKLKWILEGVHTNLECPSLEILQLGGCEQVILASKFASSNSSQETSQQNQLQTCIQLPLPNLLELDFGICHVKLPSTSFKKLKVLKLENCEKLRFIFPSSIARGLSLLEELEIRRCNNMGVIVVKEEKDRIEDGDVILFHKLQTLVLEDLPELVSFLSTRSSFMTDSGQIITEGNRDLHMPLLHHQVAYPNLTKLHLRNLPKIKHVWSKDPQTILRFQNLRHLRVMSCASLKSLFTVSVGTCLKKLNEITINDCGLLEEIVGGEGGEAMGRTLVFVFPQVTHLSLSNLPRLECFYRGVHISKWPMLETMSIQECKKVEVFASGLMSFEETVEERQYSQMSIKQPLFLVDEMSFPSLEILRIYEMEKLEIIWNIKDSHQRHMYSFPNLLHIDVSLCESLKSLFPATLVAASLPQLQSIMITGCVVMEEIVEREDGTDPTTRLLFPSLICLGLYGLPKLKWFFQGVSTLESSSSMELHEQGGTLFMVEEVAFPNLKLLDLYGLPKIKHIWNKDSQTIRSFQNLQVIIAGKCVSLKSLFPVSIVRCLEQLEKIKVYDCGLEEIVAAEGGAVVEMTVVFPRVTSLCLENLGGLKGVDDSKWLMPKEMQVLECENVKLSFPSLVTLEIRRMYKLEIMSRNVTIRKLWRSCYARCLHAIESYRLRRALRPHATLYEVNKMAYVSYGFLDV